MRKGIAIFASLILSAGMLTGCQSAPNPLAEYNFDEMQLVQFDEPKEGAPIAIVETDLGTMKMVLYPEYAPKTVENFVSLAKEGFYDNKSIFGIQEGVYFITGGTDVEGEQSWKTITGEPIPNEYDVDLWPFKGAVMAFNERAGFYGDSRFFVVNSATLTDEDKKTLEGNKKESGGTFVPQELLDIFINGGGVIGLSGRYTVFAQTYEGLEVLDKITALEVVDKEKNLKPKEDVFVKKVTISEYKKEA